jgi:trk system potassium uptake protein TrkH
MFMLVVSRGGSPHKLFGAEGHKINVDRPVPGLANTIRVLFSIYAGFTCFIALALFALGMPLFDSICHSFTTLSTGGFSPHDASIEYYRLSGYPNYVWFDYVITLGMLMGGTSFVIHYRVLKGSWKGGPLLVELHRHIRCLDSLRKVCPGCASYAYFCDQPRLLAAT